MSKNYCINHQETQSSRWRLTAHGYLCDKCFKPKKVRTDILTTTSHRVQADRLDNEKEMLQPYGVGEKPTPEFAKAYPDMVEHYYTQKELNNLGMKKIKTKKHEKFKKENYEKN